MKLSKDSFGCGHTFVISWDFSPTLFLTQKLETAIDFSRISVTYFTRSYVFLFVEYSEKWPSFEIVFLVLPYCSDIWGHNYGTPIRKWFAIKPTQAEQMQRVTIPSCGAIIQQIIFKMLNYSGTASNGFCCVSFYSGREFLDHHHCCCKLVYCLSLFYVPIFVSVWFHCF